MLLTRKRKILAKIEGAYGTDAAPVAATDAVLLRDLTVTPLDLDYDERTQVRPYLGNFQQVVGASRVKLEITLEAAGFSNLATPTPGYDALLRACGLASTVSAGPPATVAYNPISSAFESVTVYYEKDGLLLTALGCRGTIAFDMAEKKIPTFKITLTGTYGGLADQDIGAPDTSAFLAPLAVNSVNTSGLTVQGFANAILRSFSLDFGNQVQDTSYVGDVQTVSLTDRQVAGKISVQATKKADFDWYQKVLDAVLGTFAIQHGPVNNQIQIAAPAVELAAPAESDDKGIAFLDLDLRFLPSAGNDEVTITMA